MRRLIISTIVFLLPVILSAQPLLQRLSRVHGPFWSEAFASDDWRGRDIGFVAVKHTSMLYVVRQDARHAR